MNKDLRDSILCFVAAIVIFILLLIPQVVMFVGTVALGFAFLIAIFGGKFSFQIYTPFDKKEDKKDADS